MHVQQKRKSQQQNYFVGVKKKSVAAVGGGFRQSSPSPNHDINYFEDVVQVKEAAI